MVAGLSLRDRLRSSDIERELGVEPLLLHVERSQLRWFGHLIRMPPGRQLFRGFPGRSNWEETPGNSQDKLEGLYLPQNELLSVAVERDVWVSLLGYVLKGKDSLSIK